MTKIVQCPSCNTKFALNESQLAGIESPKFQCSRCQTIFNVTEEKSADTEDQITPTKIQSPEPTLDAPSGKWNLGEEINSSENEDPYLKDFSIDLGKFSLGPSSGVPGVSPKDSGTQLDFGFNKPDISHRVQDTTHTPQETSLPEKSQRDAPTKVHSRLDIETLDNVIYGESGQKDSPLSLDWESNEKQVKSTAEFMKVSELGKDIESDHKDTQETNTGDLSSIFRGGSERSTTGTHFRNVSLESSEDLLSSATPLSSTAPSWSELKEKMEKQDEDIVTDSSDLSSIDQINFPYQEPTPESPSQRNRSMRHTTVIQRDSLEIEGFLKPIDEDEEHIDSPKVIVKKIQSFDYKALQTSLATFFTSLLHKPKDLSPFTKSLMVAWSVPVLFLGLLFIWGQTLGDKQNLNQVEKAFTETVTLFIPPELLLPPVTLVVNNLIAELRPDKTGEPMVVISGNLFNAGLQTVLNPTVEARTFDKNNALVKSIQAPVPNELSRYASSLNLTEITKDEIIALQNKRSWDGISPSKSIPFKLVVTDIGQGYKYFSAKLYSVSEIS